MFNCYQRLDEYVAIPMEQTGRNQPPLNLAFLGVPYVQCKGQEVAFRTRKALALLIYLAVDGGKHTRDQLATMFWPEYEPQKGRASLRSTLAYLRRGIHCSTAEFGEGDKKPGYLIIDQDILQFDSFTDFTADWLTLQTAWQAARTPIQVSVSSETHNEINNLPPQSLLTQLQNAAYLYRDDFLTGFSLKDTPEFDDWISFQREVFHRQMSLVFDRLTQILFEGGELMRAIEITSRWTALDPLSEIAYRRLMQLYFATEDRPAALHTYETCQTILARELNADPSPETQALAQRIRSADLNIRDSGIDQNLMTSDAKHRFKATELPLVGRSREHLALVTAFRATRRGQTQVIVLEGEPGIGKTRLAKEFLGWAKAQGADILQGRAFGVNSQLPYQAIIEALRERVERENAPEDLLSDLWLVELSRLLPELRDRYPDLSPPSYDETLAQTHLFEAVTRLCLSLADRTTTVLFLDDLQWVNPATLDLLQYTCRRWTTANTPILLVFTLRPEELDTAGETGATIKLRDWLLTLQIDTTLIRFKLEPLNQVDVQRLVQSFSPWIVDKNFTDKNHPPLNQQNPARLGVNHTLLNDFSRELFVQTGGQPFFLIETLKMLFEPVLILEDEKQVNSRAIPLNDVFDKIAVHYLQSGEKQKIPPNVEEMISVRFSHLSPLAQTACICAAVLGDSFDFMRLQHVADLSEKDTLEALEELLKRGFLREQRQTPAHPYVVAHDHFREVVYAQTTAVRRSVFHRRAFEELTKATASSAELARHAWAAGLPEKAFELSVKAGEEAMKLYAPQSAIKHFTHALEAEQQLEISPNLKLHRTRGLAYETVGDFESAQNDFQQALKDAQTRDDLHDMCQAFQDLGFLWSSRDYVQARDYFQQALAIARKMENPSTLARSLNRVGNWNANIGRPAQALVFHQEALAISENMANPANKADTLDLLGMAYYMTGDMQQSLSCYEQAVALFQELDNRRGLVSALAMMSMVMWATFTIETPPTTDVMQSVPLAELAVNTAQEIGWRAGEAHAWIALGQILTHLGKYAQALDAIQTGLNLATEIKHTLWTTYAYWALGLVHWHLMAYPKAQGYLEQSLAFARETGSVFWLRVSVALLALILISQSKCVQAQSVLEEVLGSEKDSPELVDWASLTTMQRLVWYVQAETAFARREPGIALQIVEYLITTPPSAQHKAPAPRLSKLKGDILSMLGQVAEAETAFHTAHAGSQNDLPLLFRIHLSLGQLYDNYQQESERIAQIKAAQRIMDELVSNLPVSILQDNFSQEVTKLFLKGN